MIDKLNNLTTKYPKIDYREWFSVMDIPEEDIEKRVELAEKMDDVFEWLFMMVTVAAATTTTIDTEYLVASVEYRLFDLVDINVKYVSEHLVKVANEVVETTITRRDEEYFLSEQRASKDAANEAHAYCTLEEMEQAWKDGKTKKTWHTQNDKLVRKTHAVMEGKTIPIDSLFLVGDSEMAAPHDTEHGADLKEVAGCRCWLTYS